jgi:hypothetical protein
MQRLVLGLVCVLALTESAAARPPPNEVAYTPEPKLTLIEWSTWLRGSVVIASDDRNTTPVDATARVVAPVDDDHDFAGAAGFGFTLPIGHHARIGAWAEFRGWDAPLVGGELTLIPGELDMFQYNGNSAITARAGGNPSYLTAQLGFGYRAPWNLFGDQPRSSRYMIGVSIVSTVTQSRFDRGDWSATLGLEFEPVGALRYLLGVRSWYH